MFPPTSTLASNQHSVSDLKRPCVKFAPNIWGDFFLQYASESMEVDDNVTQQAQLLKEEVKRMFQSTMDENIIRKLNFVDLIQRFGISYHFQHEIDQALDYIYTTFTNDSNFIKDGDHHSLGLLFRLLRQHGYRISSDVFNKLKSDQGNYNETLVNDIQGLCSFYEAANLRTHGDDDILEEAYDFSNTQLKSLAKQLSPSLAAQINHYLRQPFNKIIPRFEARYHMTLYEQDPSHNKTLLTFAKLDFNILQKMHQKEIGIMTKWWRKSNFVKKVPYKRDRVVEGYAWSLAMYSKPEHYNRRIFMGKLLNVMCLIDDTYDAYGTLQELELLTEAIQRWDISLIGSLPEGMKVLFDTVVEMCEEIELMTTESGKSSFVVPHFQQAICNVIKAYMVEAQWCHDGHLPTYDEYKVIGILTSGNPLFITLFIGLDEEFVTEDLFNWISSQPIIIEASSIIGRVLNDLASHKFEQERVHVASAVECCMKQYNISQTEAHKLLHKDVEDYWKVINEECLELNDIPKSVLDCTVNLARICETMYENHQDRYTNGELLKDLISSLFVDPMCLE